MMILRTYKIKIGDNWIPIRFQDIKKGDTIRSIDDGETYTQNGMTDVRVLTDPKPNDAGVLQITVEWIENENATKGDSSND